MTAKQAIKGLNNQKTKLEKIDSPIDFLLWKNQTLHFMEASFKDGKETSEYKSINEIDDYPSIQEEKYDRIVNVIKLRLNKFIDNAIETIQLIGVPKRGNLLSRISDGTIWTIIAFAVPSLIGAGIFLGNIYSDKQNIELRQEVKSLKDTISLFRASPLQNTNPVSNTDTNKTNDPKNK